MSTSLVHCEGAVFESIDSVNEVDVARLVIFAPLALAFVVARFPESRDGRTRVASLAESKSSSSWGQGANDPQQTQTSMSLCYQTIRSPYQDNNGHVMSPVVDQLMARYADCKVTQP